MPRERKDTTITTTLISRKISRITNTNHSLRKMQNLKLYHQKPNQQFNQSITNGFIKRNGRMSRNNTLRVFKSGELMKRSGMISRSKFKPPISNKVILKLSRYKICLGLLNITCYFITLQCKCNLNKKQKIGVQLLNLVVL